MNYTEIQQRQHELHAESMGTHMGPSWAVNPNGTVYCDDCGLDIRKVIIKKKS